ncbi:MAG: polysaccharide deacetylase [Lachnospiraceae bacterium]|nr:polysaccharide deacetylase [Lachnospiraceae bacterium]
MILYYCFPQGKTKALTMSYDDGRLQDERLVSIFNKYGIRGTFNLNYGLMERDDRVSRERAKELYKGHEIATHTLLHPTIARSPLTMVAQEILEDRKGLETLTDYPVRGHAYPNGSYTKEIEELFAKLGIAYGRVVPCKPTFELPDNPMEWYATCHHNDPKLMEYGNWLIHFKKHQYLKLMYVWGHSYEFDDRDNWQVIEEFCALMGGREDIWYATNIEIIDYMQVLKRLQFNAAGDAVYNPSAASAWLEADGKMVEVKGGCYTKLA